MPLPFLLLIAVNLDQPGCLCWKLSLWSVRTWLAVQRSKSVFLLILYDSIDDMKHSWTVWITPQPCNSHFSCWLLPIWPLLDFWAEDGAYGLCQLGWWYNGEKLSFHWPYMKVSIIWNSFELSQLQLSRTTAIFVVDSFQFGPSWMFGMKMELMACAHLVGSTTEQSYLFTYETLLNCLHYTSAVVQPFLFMIAANLGLAGFLG